MTYLLFSAYWFSLFRTLMFLLPYVRTSTALLIYFSISKRQVDVDCDGKTSGNITYCREKVLRHLLVDSRQLRHIAIVCRCIDRWCRHTDDLDTLRSWQRIL